MSFIIIELICSSKIANLDYYKNCKQNVSIKKVYAYSADSHYCVFGIVDF
ncbi:hypothetical protein SAMN04488514_11141 [Kriegella aquimaris]|uniref:Uncharacterized protein n=1 Tax=Kriegella aquimaris TaxID=192904 RepID=A0A1G9UJ90_9FLAO|nr:hypothetical protein SAMN04488514_11141 [Kriegella aquimaris]